MTISEIFNVLSDDNSLMLFNAIAFGNSKDLIHKTEFPEEQSSSIISTLINVGLVREQDHKYYLTSIGRVFHNAYLNLSSAMDNLWKLKCIDILEEADKMPRKELARIINTVIGDYRIREILTG